MNSIKEQLDHNKMTGQRPQTVLQLAKRSGLSRPTIYEHLETELGESFAFDRVFVGTVTRLWAALGFELILSLRPEADNDETIST